MCTLTSLLGPACEVGCCLHQCVARESATWLSAGKGLHGNDRSFDGEGWRFGGGQLRWCWSESRRPWPPVAYREVEIREGRGTSEKKSKEGRRGCGARRWSCWGCYSGGATPARSLGQEGSVSEGIGWWLARARVGWVGSGGRYGGGGDWTRGGFPENRVWSNLVGDACYK